MFKRFLNWLYPPKEKLPPTVLSYSTRADRRQSPEPIVPFQTTPPSDDTLTTLLAIAALDSFTGHESHHDCCGSVTDVGCDSSPSDSGCCDSGGCGCD